MLNKPQEEPNIRFDVYHHNSPFGNETPQEVRYYFNSPTAVFDDYPHMYVLGPKNYIWDGYVAYYTDYITIDKFLESCILSKNPEYEYIQPIGFNYKIIRKDGRDSGTL